MVLTLAWLFAASIWCECLLPRAESAAEGAANLLECALGPYSSSLLTQWRVPDEFDASAAMDHVLIRFRVPLHQALVFFAHLPGAHWGFPSVGTSGCFWTGGLTCRGFCSDAGPLQTVQRAEFIPCLVCWWSPERGRLVHAVRDHAILPGLADTWVSEWIALPAAPTTAEDVEAWPYSVGILVEWVAFPSSLHWPAARPDLGVGGVSFVEVLILYELWAGERLVFKKAVPQYRRPGRPISVSAVPLGPGTDIWRSCRFIGALFRSLCALPGGIGGFVPCNIGANQCRLRHIGWEKCSHGLTSRQGDTALRDRARQDKLNFKKNTS